MRRASVLFLLLPLALAASAPAATYIVDHGGTGDYLTVGEALAVAGAGDVVQVLPGTYVESVVLDAAVTLESTLGSGVTTLEAAAVNEDVVTVTVDGAALQGFRLTGGRYGLNLDDGVTGFACSDTRIQNTDVYAAFLPPQLVAPVLAGITLDGNVSGEHEAVRVHSGAVETSTAWPALPAGFAYLLESAVVTVAGASGPVLTIPSGAVVKSWFSRFEIGSASLPGGLVADSAIFTSLRDDSVAGDTDGSAQAPASGQWSRLDFNALARADSSRVTNCELRYGGSGGYVIHVAGSAPTVTGTTFVDNAGSFLVTASPDGGATLTGNTIQQGLRHPIACPIDCLDELVFGNTIVPRLDGMFNGIELTNSTVETSRDLPVLPHGFVYYLNSVTITVAGPAGPVLTIPTGTIVKSWFGRFEIGSATQPGGLMADGVTFTSIRDDVGGDTDGTGNVPAAGQWQRLDFNALARADSSRIANCELRYGGGEGVIQVAGSTPTVTGCTFSDNNGSIFVTNGSGDGSTLVGNTIHQGTNLPLGTDLACLDNLVFGNTIVPRGDGVYNGIRIFSSTVTASQDLPTLPHGFVYFLNSSTISVSGPDGPVLTFPSGAIVKSWFGRFEIGSATQPGGLVAEGVTFTSSRDDVGGDTDGTGFAPAAGQWQRLDFNAMARADSSRIVNCELRYGGNGEGAIQVAGSTPTVSGCTFTDNSGAIFVTHGSGDGSTLVGNTVVQGEYLPFGTDLACLDNLVFGNTLVPRGDDVYNGIRIFNSTVTASRDLPTLPFGFVYYLNSSTITVAGPDGPVLTFPPGTIVKNWFGRFEIGTATEPGGLVAENVVFTSSRDDVGGNTDGGGFAPAAGQWQRLDFNAAARADSSRIVDCEIRYGGNGGGAIQVAGSTPTVSGCLFEENAGAIYATGGSGDGSTLVGNTIVQGADLPLGADVQTMQNLLFGNTLTPRGDGTLNGIRLYSSLVGESHTLPKPPHDFVYYANSATITVFSPSAPVLTIESGTIVKNWFSRFEIGGSETPGGLMAEDVIFTSIHDDEGGDTNGATTAPAPGNWHRIDFNPGAPADLCRLEACTFRYGGFGQGMIEARDSRPVLRACTFEHSSTSGVFVRGYESFPTLWYCTLTDNDVGVLADDMGQAHLVRCCIEGNASWGVQVDTDGRVASFDARNTWWGAVDGPSGVGPGGGDAVSSLVRFDPWYDVPACTDLPSDAATPARFALHDAFPNPFNPATTIAFDLPEARWVTVDVYAVDGARVARLVDAALQAGRREVTWRGRDDDGRIAPAGVYLVRVRAGDETREGKVALLK